MFTLTIDEAAWDAAQRRVLAATPGLVPVIKGNGYGFGVERLAARCAELGVPRVAVGQPGEVAAVRRAYGGEVLVMAPAGITDAATDLGPRVLRTVAHADVLRGLAALHRPPRVVVELDSPVHRHGIAPAELAGLVPVLRRLPPAGLALHLPDGGPGPEGIRAAARAVHSGEDLRAAGVDPGPLWVSHLGAAAAARLPGEVRIRVGTALWLGDRQAFSAAGTVVDVHPAPRREAVGYRQRRTGPGTIVVVSGGTAHGVGLRAGAARGRWRDLARAAVAGAAHATGLTPSPFRWAGRRLGYADVPHMQVSMLLVPPDVPPPAIGDRLPCDVRMTCTAFDAVEPAVTPLEV